MILIRPRGLSMKPRVASINRGHPLNQGLLYWWLFNEGGGLLARDIAGSNHAALSGIAASSSLSGWWKGPRGPILAFDSTNDTAIATNNASLNGVLTVWTRVKMTSIASANTLFFNGTNLNTLSNLVITQTSAGTVRSSWNSATILTVGAFPAANVWVDICVVRTGTTGAWVVHHYINGTDRGNGSTATNPVGGTYAINVGTFTGGAGASFQIDSTRVWNRALSPAEIAALSINPLIGLQGRTLDAVFRVTATSFTYSATGGLTSGGAATKAKGKTISAAGGVTASGASAVSKTKATTATGGLSTSGASAVSKTKATTATGGLVTSGAGALSKTKATSASGGVIIAGSPALAKTKAPSVAGGVNFAGVADTAKTTCHAYLANGGVLLVGDALLAKIKTLFASGGVVVNGNAILAKTNVAIVIGGVELAGDAFISQTKAFATSGGLALAGAGGFLRTKAFSTSGGIVVAGAVVLVKVKDLLAIGGVSTNGVATHAHTRVVITFGGVDLAGESETLKTKTFSAAGGIVVSGDSNRAKIKAIDATGGVITGGDALLARLRCVVPSGGAQFDGVSVSGFDHLYVYANVDGGLVALGTAAHTRTKDYPSSGGIVFSGNATTIPDLILMLVPRYARFRRHAVRVFKPQLTTQSGVAQLSYRTRPDVINLPMEIQTSRNELLQVLAGLSNVAQFKALVDFDVAEHLSLNDRIESEAHGAMLLITNRRARRGRHVEITLEAIGGLAIVDPSSPRPQPIRAAARFRTHAANVFRRNTSIDAPAYALVHVDVPCEAEEDTNRVAQLLAGQDVSTTYRILFDDGADVRRGDRLTLSEEPAVLLVTDVERDDTRYVVVTAKAVTGVIDATVF